MSFSASLAPIRVVSFRMSPQLLADLWIWLPLRYADAAGPVNAAKYKDAIYLAGSASAELIADAAFVPFEAVKVRMQTTIPPFATGMSDGFKKFIAVEGTGGLYKSLGSLWSRQIPYTMMKFWSFEATVTKIYASLGKPKDSYNKVGLSLSSCYRVS